MKGTAIIDRFEGEKAVLLLGAEEVQVVWPIKQLPVEAHEGDILQFTVSIDKEATDKARDEAETLLKQLLANNQAD